MNVVSKPHKIIKTGCDSHQWTGPHAVMCWILFFYPTGSKESKQHLAWFNSSFQTFHLELFHPSIHWREAHICMFHQQVWLNSQKGLKNKNRNKSLGDIPGSLRLYININSTFTGNDIQIIFIGLWCLLQYSWRSQVKLQNVKCAPAV